MLNPFKNKFIRHSDESKIIGKPFKYSFIIEGEKLFIPLAFWHFREPNLVLPDIALSYHEVRVHLDSIPIIKKKNKNKKQNNYK